MVARNDQKQNPEVRRCAILSTIHRSLKTTCDRFKRSAADETRPMSKSKEHDLLFTYMKIRAFTALRQQETWDYTFRPYASGEDVGPKRVSRLKISRAPVDRGIFPPKDEAQVIALACELPARYDLPLSRFTLAEIWDYVYNHLPIGSISLTTIWRWLNHHALRPWRSRMWIFPRDPNFLTKATPILDLYQGFWQGCPLGPDDFVICADEKPGLQAIERRHEPTPPKPGKYSLIEHEYVRHGTVAYLAALDVSSGRITGQVEERTGIAPFMRLVDTVMRQRLYSKARRVFWIVDNGSSHQPKTFPERLRQRYPNAIAVHLPIHASWLNQVELYFSILQRKLLTRGHFPSKLQLTGGILDFQHHYNRTADPFNWRFTAADLKQRLASIPSF